jgi:arginase family enzyme
MFTIQELLNYTSRSTVTTGLESEYLPTQLGSAIYIINEQKTEIEDLDIILLGSGEFRGQNPKLPYNNGPDLVREELYKLHYWHPTVKIGDIGNMIQGASLSDSRAALKTVLSELQLLGKKVLIIGGSHDLTLQQYNVFRDQDEIIDFTVIDMLADLDDTSGNRYDIV